MAHFRPTHRVYLTDREDPIDVQVTFPDMVVAEKEGPRNGITDASMEPMSMTLVWVWCALRRTGEGVGTFPEFRTALYDIDMLNNAPGAAADPTQQGEHTGSP